MDQKKIPQGAWMFLLCCKDGSMERKVTWRTKGFKQYNNGSKGKNPGQTKKNISPDAWMSVSWECCVLSGRERSLRQAGHSCRGVLPNVVCLKCVIAKPRKMGRPRPPRGCPAIGKKNRMLLGLILLGSIIILILITYYLYSYLCFDFVPKVSVIHKLKILSRLNIILISNS
jgi:hypothetical protein